MKKYVIFALLFVPMAAFSAPSVRVLGNNTASAGNNTSVVAKKATPAKTAPVVTNTANTSRVGTIRPKTGTVSSIKPSSESRFPVIAPNHIYNSVSTPKPTGGTTVINSEVDTDAIVNTVMQEVANNYYNQEEIDNIVNNLDEEDPRVDMIHMGNKRSDWMTSHAAEVQALEDQGYVFMWVED